MTGVAWEQVVVSGNALVRGPKNNPTYSVFFGGDYATDGERSIKMGPVTTVHNVGEVEAVPRAFGVEDFANIFNKTFSETSATVVGLINLVYIVRKVLRDWDGEKVTTGRVHRTLY